MIKKVIYFVLSIAVLAYIGVMIYVACVPDLEALGTGGKALYYISMYGGVLLLVAFAATNFTGNIFKIILLILLILAAIFYLFVIIFPDYFANVFGVAKSMIGL
ncbi:MAG TPA: hypothetical protein DEV78_02260 [Clostridiales bacterium]|nr:hypothetical protein [Clostridiales bacterium]